MRDEQPLRGLFPQVALETLEGRPLSRTDVALDRHEGVLGEDRAARVHDVGLEFASGPIPQRFLFVGDQRVAEAVLELGPGGARRRGLRHDVPPDSSEEPFARRGASRITPRSRPVLRDDRPGRASGGERVRMHDADARARQILEVADPFRVAGPHQDHEGRPIDDTAVRQRLPGSRRYDAGLGQAVGVAFEREQRQLGRDSHDDLVGHCARARERADELDGRAAFGRQVFWNAGKTASFIVSARMLKP